MRLRDLNHESGTSELFHVGPAWLVNAEFFFCFSFLSSLIFLPTIFPKLKPSPSSLYLFFSALQS